MTTQLSGYNNSWHQPGSFFKRFCWYWVNYVFFKTGLFPFYSLKSSLLKAFGARVGKSLVIKPFVNIKYPWLLEIGDHAWIGEHVWIDNLGKVNIGNNVCLSQNSFILTGNHDYSKPHFDLLIKPVVLEDGVWIGANAVVCPGVICGSHSVLTVGSVATSQLSPYGIYSGNPAQKIKDRVFEA